MTRSIVMAAAVAGLAVAAVGAQNRLKRAPGYEEAQRFTREAPTSVQGGALSVSWREDGKAFEFSRNGKRYTYEVESRHESEIVSPPDPPRPPDRPPAAAPERGRQYETAVSPDGLLSAFYRDRNVWISAAGGADEHAVTTDGSAASRIKYGTASWLYAQHLRPRTPISRSPDTPNPPSYPFP